MDDRTWQEKEKDVRGRLPHSAIWDETSCPPQSFATVFYIDIRADATAQAQLTENHSRPPS